MTDGICRWGILGTAQIARKNWLAIRNASNATLAAVASRSTGRAEAYIGECQSAAPFAEAPEAVGGYDRLLARDDIDAVYVPLPTGIRKQWVIRAAEAGGATGVVTVAGADPYGWKALRGSMGSTLRLPVVRADDAERIRADARARGLHQFAAVPRGGTPTTDADLSRPCLIWLGAEGGGLAPPLMDDADELVSVPMHAPVESLNIAVASALIVYEAARQRAHRTAPSLAARGPSA